MFGLKSIVLAESALLIIAVSAQAAPASSETSDAVEVSTSTATSQGAAAVPETEAPPPAAPAPTAPPPAPAAEPAPPAPTAAPAAPAGGAAEGKAAAPATGGSAPQPSQGASTAFGSVFGKADKTGDTRAWRIFADLTQSIGEGAFVSDSYARASSYGYLATIGGSYKLSDLVTLSARVAWTQNLTVTNRDMGTLPRELLFRDTSLAAIMPSLYKEEVTGINVGASASLILPTSKLSRWTGKLFGLGARGTLGKVFEKVGPGDLSLGYALGFTKNFGPSNPTINADRSPSTVDTCRTSALNDLGSCLSSVSTVNYGVTNDLNIAYSFLEDFTFTIDFLIWNSVSYNLGNSTSIRPVADPNAPIGTSQFANDRAPQSDLTVATIELAYSITSNLSAAVGLYTLQNPFIQDGNNSHGLRFPFWDFRSSADNLSTIYLDLAFTY